MMAAPARRTPRPEDMAHGEAWRLVAEIWRRRRKDPEAWSLLTGFLRLIERRRAKSGGGAARPKGPATVSPITECRRTARPTKGA
jgi:hypothetical protein